MHSKTFENTEGDDFTVVGEPEDLESLSQEAVFIIPFRDSNSELKGLVTYAGISPILKLNRRGVYGNGTAINTVENLKCFDIEGGAEVEYQLAGYLALLKMTEGRPTSIVVAQPRFDQITDPFDRASEVMLGYKRAWDEENEEALEAVREEAGKIAHKAAYNWFSLAGLRRRLENIRVTACYSTPEQTGISLCEIMSPGQKPLFNNLQGEG